MFVKQQLHCLLGFQLPGNTKWRVVYNFFFFFWSRYLPYVSEEDSAIHVQLLPPPLFSHKGSSWCQQELGERVDLKLVKRIKPQGIEVWRQLSMSRCQAEGNACFLSNHYFPLVMVLHFFFFQKSSDGKLYMCVLCSYGILFGEGSSGELFIGLFFLLFLKVCCV